MRTPSPLSTDTILHTSGLGKRYGKRWAVRGLNLNVYRGDIFGFLGPNGAGKSTTIRMLLSLIRPTEGDVKLFGHPLKSARSDALRSVGGIVEKPDFYLYLSACKNLEICGALSGGVKRHRILEVADMVGLASRIQDPVKTYSHGMKQRLGIAQALLSDPELIILDEPTNGLDPQGMKEVRDLIRHLAKDRRKTILLSSHLLNEIELVANRMAIINKGELVIQGGVRELLDRGEATVVVKGSPAGKLRSTVKRLRAIVSSSKAEAQGVRLTMDARNVPALTRALVRAGIRVESIIPRKSLEDFFLSITESEAEQR